MKKSKRIMALIGAILLVLLYVSTLIFAFIDSVVSQKLLMIMLLMAAIAATILLPVLLYIYTLFSRTSHTDDSDSNE